MAVGIRYYTPAPYEVDANGVPFVAGQLFFYLTGTDTPLDTFSDVDLTVPNANPVVSDSSGHFPSIWLSQTQAYKVRFFTPNTTTTPSTPADPQGVQVWTRDPVGPAAGGNTAPVPGLLTEIKDIGCPVTIDGNGQCDQFPQWYLCYGQAVSRADYSAAFALMGTTWGAGDASTTFNLPDLRGRGLAGLDNMGGSAANRITAGVSGVPGTTLGGVGGSQNAQTDTLTAVSNVTDPTHNHTTNAVKFPDATPGIGIAGGSPGYTWNAAANVAAATGITVSTVVTSGLTGGSQNVQPVAMTNKIIFLGA